MSSRCKIESPALSGAVFNQATNLIAVGDSLEPRPTIQGRSCSGSFGDIHSILLGDGVTVCEAISFGLNACADLINFIAVRTCAVLSFSESNEEGSN